MRSIRFFLSLVIVGFVLLFHSNADARFHRGPFFYDAGWRNGYWYHGTYVGRAGWWWIVGPNWYFYSAPLYPYPPNTVQPVYIIRNVDAPAPPPAPPPGGTVTTTTSAPTSAMTNQASGDIQKMPSSGSSSTSGKAKAFSYYCEKTKSYYPTVGNCADGWIATPVKAPN